MDLGERVDAPTFITAAGVVVAMVLWLPGVIDFTRAVLVFVASLAVALAVAVLRSRELRPEAQGQIVVAGLIAGPLLFAAGILLAIIGGLSSGGGFLAFFLSVYAGLAITSWSGARALHMHAGFVKIYLAPLLGAGIVLAVVGQFIVKPSGEEPLESTPASPAPLAPIPIGAPDLVAWYEANELAADEQFNGRTVEVTGRVTSIGKDLLGTPYVVLAGRGVRDVQALFPESHAAQLARLRKGTRITVIGRCEGMMMNVLVRDARIK